MKKKGVSPVIATVLLIAMVIALALIIFLWMRSFTKETVTKFEGENIELSCGKVQFQASLSGSIISIINVGNVPIYNFKVKLPYNGEYTTQSIKDFDNDQNNTWPTVGLNSGDAASVNIGGTYAGVTITPVLLGNSDAGKKTFICENQEYEL